MTYSTPRKMQRTSTGKRSRGKSQPRKLFSSGPSRTLVPRQHMPEIKRRDNDMGITTDGFAQHTCFTIPNGTGATGRIGSSVHMHALKVKFDLTP